MPLNPAEEVLSVPELFDNITTWLPHVDVVRIVRVNSSCYQNARSSNAVKRKLFYLPPDEEAQEHGDEEDNVDEVMTEDQVGAAVGGAHAQNVQPNPNPQANHPHWQRRHQGPPDHPPWPHTLDVRKINPLFGHIFPGGSIRNLSNNIALLTIPSAVYVAAGSRKVRLSWKAMLFTSQTCSALRIAPAALYSPRQAFEEAGGRCLEVDDTAGPNAGPSYITTADLQFIDWMPGRGWSTDHLAFKKLSLALEEIGETPPLAYNPGSRNLQHWTEYVARRRNEICDGWVWGQSLEDFSLANAGFSMSKSSKRGPRHGYFEETIPAEDGLIRCGQIAREIEAADWCWWILRIEP